jgi:hypothetical protein
MAAMRSVGRSGRGLLLLMAAAASGLLVAAPADAAVNARTRELLRSQGFSASLDPELTIRKVGSIRVGRRRDDIYDVVHVTPTGTFHAVQTVVVIEDGRRYLGGYLVDEAPVRIVGRDIVFPFPRADGDRLHFSRNGPPTRGVLDGKPIWFRK